MIPPLNFSSKTRSVQEQHRETGASAEAPTHHFPTDNARWMKSRSTLVQFPHKQAICINQSISSSEFVKQDLWTARAGYPFCPSRSVQVSTRFSTCYLYTLFIIIYLPYLSTTVLLQYSLFEDRNTKKRERDTSNPRATYMTHMIYIAKHTYMHGVCCCANDQCPGRCEIAPKRPRRSSTLCGSTHTYEIYIYIHAHTYMSPITRTCSEFLQIPPNGIGIC